MSWIKHALVGKASIQFDCKTNCDTTLALLKNRGLMLRDGAAPQG